MMKIVAAAKTKRDLRAYSKLSSVVRTLDTCLLFNELDRASMHAHTHAHTQKKEWTKRGNNIKRNQLIYHLIICI